MKKISLVIFAFVYVTFAFAQKNKELMQSQIEGTWTLVSVVNIFPDSTRVYPYGTDPKGLLTFDAKSYYSIQILKSKRPKVASGDKNNCTAEENAAIVQGTNSHFGHYSIDEKNKIITFKIESASFPNWEGTEQKRLFTINGNDIKYVVTNTTQGGQSVIAEVVWRRI